MRNEDQLAAVMSHEFGHIYSRHVHKGMNRQMAAMGLTGAAGVAGYAAGGSESGHAVRPVWDHPWSGRRPVRQHGVHARRRGPGRRGWLPFLHACRVGPAAVRRDFFEHMISMGLDTTSALASDHPTLKSRVEAANKRVAQLQERGTIDKRRQPNTATPEQFQRYKQLAVQASQGTPNDQQVLTATKMLQALPRSCWVPYEQKDELDARKELLDLAQKK